MVHRIVFRSDSPSLQLLPRLALVVVGAAIGAILLVLLLRGIDLDQLGQALSSADQRLLALSLIPFLVNWLLKVPRWAILFGDDAPDWDTLFGGMNVGYAVNTLLPARLGEIVRAYWVRDRSGVSMVQTLSTVALERVADGVLLLALLIIVIPTVPFPSKLLGPAMTVGAVFVAALLAMAVLVYGTTRNSSFLATFLERLERGRVPRVGQALRQLVVGLQALRYRRSLFLLLGYTVIVWISNVVFVWLLLRSFHLDVPLLGAALLVAVTNLGMAIPSSPGYVGVFEYLVVLTLSLYGVGRVDALAAALTLHFIAFAPVTVVGLIYIARGLGSTLHMLRMGLTRSG